MNRYITIPPFSYPSTWLGAPYCIGKFDFESNFSMSIVEEVNNIYVNFVPVLAWKAIGLLQKQRYALWKRNATPIYVDLYAQQTIPPFFSIEIWTVFGAGPTENPTDIVIPISKTEIPTSIGTELGSLYSTPTENVDMPQQLV